MPRQERSLQEVGSRLKSSCLGSLLPSTVLEGVIDRSRLTLRWPGYGAEKSEPEWFVRLRTTGIFM